MARRIAEIVFALSISLAALAALASRPAAAQDQSLDGRNAGLAAPRATSIKKLTGVWIEGPGYDVTYGATYDTCAARCLGAEKCVMLEYYRPEKKCNLYDARRPHLNGGASFVGVKG